MKLDDYRATDIANDIIEQSPAIAIRVTGENGNWKTRYITKNISQYGYRWEDFMLGTITWADVVHPEDFDQLCNTLDAYEKAGIDHYTTCYRILTADGKSVWMTDLSTVVRDENGLPIYSDCIVSDYTSLKDSQDQIEDNARQQAVLNNILQGLHAGDPEEAFKIILDQTGRYLGISRVLLFEDSADHTYSQAVHEWCNDGIPSMMEDGPFRLCYQRDIPEIAKDLEETGMRAVNYGEIPEGSKAEFEREQVVAAAMFAVYLGSDRYGFLCFDECVQQRIWRGSTLDFLKNIARLVSTAIIRKQSDDSMHTYQVTLSTVLDNIPTYVYVADPENNEIIFANHAFKRDFTYGEAVPKTSAVHEVITRQCENFSLFSLENLKDKPCYLEVEFVEQDMWMGVQLSVIPWVDGRLVRLFSCQDLSERKRTEEHIQSFAFMDQLTGLPNRYRCDIDLQEAVENTRVTGKSGYLLFIDMDDFKIVNDGYGHDHGDALLVEVSSFLQQSLGPRDKVYRFGGDEFVVLIEPAEEEEILDYAQKLLQRAGKPWRVYDRTFYCTFSIGIVRFCNGDSNITDILKNADIAMYDAKQNGKDGFALYNSSLQNRSIERAEMESMMRNAISNQFEGFVLYYQPMINLGQDKIVGAEALLRWFSPTGELIMPGEFISLAEYLGLIVPIGEFVLREATTFLRHINEKVDPCFSISVNVSIRQLQQHDFVQRVEAILVETGVSPGNLVLEVTEGIAATDHQRIMHICQELREKGIQIAMDDFGTGYSSLSNMRNMPLDIIKIDRSFVQSEDAYSQSLIRLITDLGHTMDKLICVEGVETEKQLHYCNQVKTDTVQGFYYYRPMPEENLLGVIQTHEKETTA